MMPKLGTSIFSMSLKISIVQVLV